MNNTSHVLVVLLSAAVWQSATALDVRITPEIESVTVTHEGQPVVIQRNQDPANTVDPYYAHTSRKCPPFCIQPMNAAPGVETIGELEVLAYLKQIEAGDKSVLVVDTRTSQWPKRGMIPGAINVPWSSVAPDTADPGGVRAILENTFGARYADGAWDFGPAKMLVLYCNGSWCSQSNSMVISLLRYGYPPAKLKWYRGGMQAWSNLGLTTVRSDR
jgi:rhodanese-related sulfurtransferase